MEYVIPAAGTLHLKGMSSTRHNDGALSLAFGWIYSFLGDTPLGMSLMALTIVSTIPETGVPDGMKEYKGKGGILRTPVLPSLSFLLNETTR